MPTSHALKTLPEYYDAVESGAKTFELRRNDRNFQVGDELLLWRWPIGPNNSKHILSRTVTYVLAGPIYGLAEGYVVMGLSNKGETS